MSMPFVQIIIVTWNKKNDILRLLNCLRALDYPTSDFAILVVDNGSSDGSADAIEADFPEVTLLRHVDNLGGSGGFNAGMQWALTHQASADYFWLLDNDALVDNQALKVLTQVLEAHSEAALCGSRVMNAERPDEIVEVGAFINNRIGEVSCHIPPTDAAPDAVFSVDYAAACSLLARVSVVRQVGLWYEEFFVYWDDMEWGTRMRAAGYAVLASNASIVWHPAWDNRTIDHSALWRSYYRTRNALCFFNHTTHGLHRRWLLFRVGIKHLAVATNIALNGHTSLSQTFMQGLLDFLCGSMGKKKLISIHSDLASYGCPSQITKICVLRSRANQAINLQACMQTIAGQVKAQHMIIVAPQSEQKLWLKLVDNENLYLFPANDLRHLTLWRKLKLSLWLAHQNWQCAVTGPTSTKWLAIWGKPILRIDWQQANITSIERISYSHIARLLKLTAYSAFRLLIFPPKDRLATIIDSKRNAAELSKSYSHKRNNPL